MNPVDAILLVFGLLAVASLVYAYVVTRKPKHPKPR